VDFLRLFRLIALNGILVALYVLLGRLTFAASIELGNVSHIMFAPQGVMLAFAILFGTSILPSVLLGQTILSCWSGVSLLGGLGLGAFSTLCVCLGGYLFQRLRLSRGFDHPRDVGWFALMIFCILQPISATGNVSLLYVIGRVPAEISEWLGSAAWLIHSSQKPLPSLALVPAAWVSWWLTNSLGQLLMTPLLVAWLTPRKHTTPAPQPLRLAAMLVGTAGVLLLIYYNPALRPVLLTLEYALIIWIGLRHSIRAVSAFNLLVMAITIWEAAQGDGFLSNLPTQDRLFYVSFFVATGVFASLMLFAMFEERRALIRQLTEIASQDALTQLSNRRHFMECAERELTLAKRHAYPLSLVLIDLDHFKAINDRHGHETGDQALALIGKCCSKIIRSTDMAGRLGGEEFALLLLHASAEDAVHTTARLQQMLREAPLRSPTGAEVHITFSAGVVQSSPQASLAEMYRAADQAMYDAKHAGRDRVHKTALELAA